MISKCLIVVDRPGREVEYIGGLLSNLKTKLQLYSRNKNINLECIKPHIVYTVIENINNKPLKLQLEEIKSAAKILGFTWEGCYNGKKYFNNLTKFKVYDELNRKFNKIINFYKPDIIFCYDPTFISGTLIDHELDHELISHIIYNIISVNNIPFINFGKGYNFEFILSMDEFTNKLKAITQLTSCFKFNDVERIKCNDLINGIKYNAPIEYLNIIKLNNIITKFLEV